MKKLKSYIVAHKIISTIVAVVVLGGGYMYFKSGSSSATATSYIYGSVQKGTIIQTVTGSGQVSASQSIDLAPKASGDLVYIGVTPGQTVKAGQLVAEVDPTTAQKAVRDAEANLLSAQISYQKLVEPADQVSVLQANSSVAQATQSKASAEANLSKDYDSGFNTVTTAFVTLPGVMTGLQNLLYSYSSSLGGNSQWNIDYYISAAIRYNTTGAPAAIEAATNAKYQIALSSYNKAALDYRATNRDAATSTLEALISESYQTAKDIADATKAASDLIQFYEDQLSNYNVRPNPTADTQLATLNTYTSQVNTSVTNLLNAGTAITNDKTAIVNANTSLAQSSASLTKLQTGADPLDIQSSQLNLQQRQNSLQDAKDTLANYYVYAPFDGVISKVNLIKGQSAGGGTAVATIITTQQLASLTLNEIDAAKISLGQKATLTFDAIDGLTIAGQVSQIDTQGTVSQGVVSYNVQIAFATLDSRIKPGMTVNASIITAVKSDVLTVPSSAVKTSGGTSYVQVVTSSSTPPVLANQTVVVGLSNNTSTEIVSGLNEGDKIVTRTITGTAATTASTPSLLGAIGGNRAAGTTVRATTIGR